MAEEVQISCINKIPRNDPYHRITHVGGKHNGKQWKETLDAAIKHIESGTYSFYVQQPYAKKVKVVVAISPARNKYLKTEADAKEPNNLLSLPECP